jgi:hypothetical protein
MKTLAALLFFWVTAISTSGLGASQDPVFDTTGRYANTHLRIHNVGPAHRITLGSGAKVGIIGHSFEEGAHPGLYAGAKRFSGNWKEPQTQTTDHQGYWMALAVREIAPNADIYALDVPDREGERRPRALARALNWALENDLDVVTYCAASLSERERQILDPVVDRVVQAGLVVVFVDYSNPSNLLPAGFGTLQTPNDRAPDLNIFSYDCTSLLAGRLQALPESDDDDIQRHRPFLAQPSSGPFTAGLVALMRSVDPDASPQQIKRVLMESSRPVAYGGREAAKVPDAFEAVTRMVGVAL